jgi:DNA oxidative demethylase
MTMNLFDLDPEVSPDVLGPGTAFLRGFALAGERDLLADLDHVIAQAPFRHMLTPGGYRMSVAMSNCGPLGWTSDRKGYRYGEIDPQTGDPWPALPASFSDLATRAASAAGFHDFLPDACLINRYQEGAKLSLHQDKDERDFGQPIVSVSLGLPATFLFGGLERAGKTTRLPLIHGDVVVWGGPARLRYHGVAPLKRGSHPLIGEARINLTFRKAG